MSDLMSRDEIIAVLEEVQAVKKGHFVLTSGRHSDIYIQCARVLESPRLTYELARVAVSKLPDAESIDLVVSPAVGGILYGFAVAQVLGVNFIFAERECGTMVFRRSFSIPQGARVLVCEDVVTTGGSVKEVCSLVEQAGGTVACVSSLIDRGAERKFTQDFYPLVELPTDSWAAEDCSLCKEGVPTYSPGSRRLNEKR